MSRRTIIRFVIYIALFLVCAFVADWVFDAFHIQDEKQRGLIFGAVVIPLNVFLAFLEWRSGFYRLRE